MNATKDQVLYKEHIFPPKRKLSKNFLAFMFLLVIITAANISKNNVFAVSWYHFKWVFYGLYICIWKEGIILYCVWDFDIRVFWLKCETLYFLIFLKIYFSKDFRWFWFGNTRSCSCLGTLALLQNAKIPLEDWYFW